MNPTNETTTSGTFNVAAANTCGRRYSMEDAHKILLEQDVRGTPITYLGVFDGHGGDHTAKWAAENLHRHLLNQPNLETQSIQTAFMAADAEYATASPGLCRDVGCTAAVAIIMPLMRDSKVVPGVWRVITAHAGDSRVLIINPQNDGDAPNDLQSVYVTDDHKPENEGETARIKATGGFVRQAYTWMGPMGPARVNGDLSLSRALGDFRFKDSKNITPDKQAITALPDVSEHLVTERARIVLACDGVFEQMDNPEAVQVIRDADSVEEAARILVKTAYESGSGDNISVVCLEWASETRRRAAEVDTRAPTRIQSPNSDTESDESWDAVQSPAGLGRSIMIAGPSGITVEPERPAEITCKKFNAMVEQIAAAGAAPMYVEYNEFKPNGLEQLTAVVKPSTDMELWNQVVKEKLVRMRKEAGAAPQIDPDLLLSGHNYRITMALQSVRDRERELQQRVRELNADLGRDIIPQGPVLLAHLRPFTLANLHQRHPLRPEYATVKSRIAALDNQCVLQFGIQYCTKCREHGGH